MTARKFQKVRAARVARLFSRIQAMTLAGFSNDKGNGIVLHVRHVFKTIL